MGGRARSAPAAHQPDKPAARPAQELSSADVLRLFERYNPAIPADRKLHIEIRQQAGQQQLPAPVPDARQLHAARGTLYDEGVR